MIKKKVLQNWLITLLILVSLGSALLTVNSQTVTIGDVNNDGAINIVDALMTAQYTVGLIPPGFNTSAADTNCDSMINIVDALKIAQYYVGLITSLACPGATFTRTATMTPTPTASQSNTQYTGNSTWFTGIGGVHYGGCGIAQANLDTQYHVALNVQDSPNDYKTFLDRPITPQNAAKIGMFNNGLNCGRWIRVTISDYCNGINDGAENEPFCRGGTGWAPDAYNGAVLDMIVGDSCHDGNSWCRDDRYHVDLSRDALNKFVLNGKPVGDLEPDHYNNRQIKWQFIEAPNYTGDIRIAFIKDAQLYWPTIAITHLKNGLHGVDYYDGSSWIKAKMNSDMGQTYVIAPTSNVNGVPGDAFRIRVYDAADQLINNARIYNFKYPASCGTNCPAAFNEVTYTIE